MFYLRYFKIYRKKESTIPAIYLKMVCNTYNHNISIISWQSVLLVEVIGENRRPVESHRQSLSHYVASRAYRYERDSNSKR